MAKRKSLSKKVRFEVFKRDSFTCQYCGETPPKVILHVDHIIPASVGGPDDIDNLITSCRDCNLGKGANSLQNIPQSLKEKAEEIQEREDQIKGYSKIIKSKRKRLEKEAMEIIRLFVYEGDPVDKQVFLKIKQFIEKLGFNEVYEVSEWVVSNVNVYKFTTNSKPFLILCKVCWRKIKQQGEEFSA